MDCGMREVGDVKTPPLQGGGNSLNSASPKTARIRADNAQPKGFQGKPNPADGILVER